MTPEAAAERAAVVAWLEGQSLQWRCEVHVTLRLVAKCIQDGDHVARANDMEK